jgi:hypothetical protein
MVAFRDHNIVNKPRTRGHHVARPSLFAALRERSHRSFARRLVAVRAFGGVYEQEGCPAEAPEPYAYLPLEAELRSPESNS